MVAEYVGGVSGKEVYNKLGKTAVEKYDLTVTVDGNADKDVLKAIAKDNKDDLTGTDTGVLTQVFVDDDNKAAAVVEINTYLGIADSDYSAKKDEAQFTVWGLYKDGKTYKKTVVKDGKATTDESASFPVSGEDFDVSKVEEDDAYLFTVAGGEVQTFVPAETIKDTEITSFKKGSNVTVGGTKYEFNAAAYFDAKALKVYTGLNDSKGDTAINLKDTTYNVYLDTYGNLIGLEEVDAVDNYVFITGADASSSNLATKTTDANAIFLDGTSKIIEVSNTKGDSVDDKAIVNEWFTYTVDKNGVYTLKTIVSDTFDHDNNKVGQKHQKAVAEIDKKHVTLNGNGDFDKVYGNANSIYLTASLKKVTKTGNKNYAVISGIDNVTTGVKNASIKTWTETQAQTDADKDLKASDWTGTSYGVYTLFKDNGYVIAAVVVGDDAASTKNLVYSHKSDVELESYDKTEDEWTWTRKVVNAKGEEIVLTEKSDSLSELNQVKKGLWYQVKYDAKGNVIEVDDAANAFKSEPNKYITDFADIQKAVNKEDTVLLEIVADAKTKTALEDKLSLKGSTLYDVTSTKSGVAVDDDTHIVFIQTNDNKTTTSYETGIKALETALKNLNEVSKGVYNYEFSAYIEDGIATTVVIRDLEEVGYTDNGSTGNTDLKVTVKNGAIAVTGPKAPADVTTDEMTSAIVDALSDLGYKDVKVTVSGGDITKVVGTKNSVEYDFGTPSYTKV